MSPESWIETLGVVAIIIMVGSYALEDASSHFIILFSAGCALAATYAWLIGSWPFLIAEGLWSLIALRRWIRVRQRAPT
ncbi:hypothetical protein [Minwuia sp.]|uniref:hypothetical protein n=1 Tax=Minwuia sp. TaxID=2493630 RepID=UPI003A8EF161